MISVLTQRVRIDFCDEHYGDNYASSAFDFPQKTHHRSLLCTQKQEKPEAEPPEQDPVFPKIVSNSTPHHPEIFPHNEASSTRRCRQTTRRLRQAPLGC